jgi:hypothetical protein
VPLLLLPPLPAVAGECCHCSFAGGCCCCMRWQLRLLPLCDPRPWLFLPFFLPAGTFRILLLRKRGIVVSAATVRAFGTLFGEVPFVATREGYRREGHCRRLMQAG